MTDKYDGLCECEDRIKILGTVERFNRQAAAVGQNGKIKPAKGVVQLKKTGSQTNWQIWVSVTKDLDGQRYQVENNILKLRTNFVAEGKLTVEFRTPPFNLMLRDCKSADLEKLVNAIEKIQAAGERKLKITDPSLIQKINCTAKGISSHAQPQRDRPGRDNESQSKSGSGPGKCSQESNRRIAPRIPEPPTKPTTSTRNSQSSQEEKDEIKWTAGNGVKRPMSHTDMSRAEATSIRKCLKLATATLVINQRSDYPLRGFPSDLKRLTFNGLLLKKIDHRIQDLFHLKYLALPENKIASIEMLAHLKSQLVSLNLSSNQIEVISDNVFRAKAFTELRYLNLSKNRLKTLPSSILSLKTLTELHCSNNLLQVLPYNVHWLTSLITLKIDDNRLRALPFPITLLRLNMLDISGNMFPENLTHRKDNFKLESTTTLFERAGSVLLTTLSKMRESIRLLDPSILPKIILEYLSRGKYCRQCGNMCLRYMISYQYSSQSIAQEMLKSIRNYPLCLIRCDSCSKNEM